MAKSMDKVVWNIQTSLDTTRDRLKTEVHGYISKRSVNRITWFGVFILSVANLLSIVTFSAPGWGWTTEVAGIVRVAGKYNGLYGVWYVCWTDVDDGYLGMCDSWAKLDPKTVPSWIGWFQAVSVLVLIFGLTSFAIQLAYICVPSANKNTIVLLSFAGMTLLTGAFTFGQWLTFLIGFLRDTFFCCKPDLVREITNYKLSYCFIISCVCSGLYFFTVIIAAVEWAALRKQYRQVVNPSSSSNSDW